jgi:predicted DNA-binding protein (UPF0251 family)
MHALETIHLGLDELEAMRLCDGEGFDQQSAGAHMGISRGTVQRLVVSGRKKVICALLSSSALVIENPQPS